MKKKLLKAFILLLFIFLMGNKINLNAKKIKADNILEQKVNITENSINLIISANEGVISIKTENFDINSVFYYIRALSEY